MLTAHDEQLLVTYWRVLDAEADGPEQKEVARIMPHIHPDPRVSARLANRSLAIWRGVKWVANRDYHSLLRGGATK
ncbi:DUF2285 domain-containing protein [Bradyrhizobium macuxiense]|uniref:DUF2285 domain-containing protein n=1 Tax=Bradyrhizobium macuxiense TaxID=1755647 RepID=UPI001FEE3B74|nr:DUF2285 domain-containing protein [Bradyrhizobium macuxiense]